MRGIEETLGQMRRNAKDVRFSDLCKVCDHHFGKHRQGRASHRVYKTPW